MRVKAIAVGYYGILRHPGDVFEVPEKHSKASWYVPEHEAVMPPEPEGPPKEPETLHEAQSQAAKDSEPSLV